MQQVNPTDDWPSDLLQVLGQIVIAMGQLDYGLDLGVKRASRLQYQEGMSLAQRMRNEEKLKRIKKQLAGEREQARLEFEEIEEAVSRIYEIRNRVFHALYCQDETGNRRRFARDTRNPYRARDEGLNLNDFVSLRDEARYWRSRLEVFTRQQFLTEKTENED